MLLYERSPPVLTVHTVSYIHESGKVFFTHPLIDKIIPALSMIYFRMTFIDDTNSQY